MQLALPALTRHDGPGLIAELVAQARLRAGADASPAARREALLATLEGWTPNASEREVCADGYDVPGMAYEALISGAERRDAGQFATPNYAADLMAAWLLREPVDLLLDPGVGSGRLLYRAGLRENGPETFLGLDTDRLVVELARRNLKWRGLADRAEVRVADFFASVPERPDAITCNPPYSRHHSLSNEAKASIHDGLEQRLGVRFSRLAALHALFFVRAIEVGRPGARIAFITPGDWLDTAYGRKVKQWVLEHATVDALVFFPEDALPFGGSVMSSAVITFVRKHQASGGTTVTTKTRVVRLPHQPPVVEDVLAAATGVGEHSLRVEEVELTPSGKWSRPAPKRNGGVALSELARVRRGIATGSNGFFVVSDATRRQWKLPLDELRACVTSPRAFDGLEIRKADFDALAEKSPRWIIACWREDAECEESPLGAYLRHGRALGVPDGYLASRRKPWHGLDRREPPAILWPYFNRARLRFVRNRADALPLNTWLGVEPHEDVDADRLWRALNDPLTMEHLVASRRSYAGMTKLEPAELGEVSVRWRA
ncbi:MAG TPA: N-6 DNA methylase [Thermoleophilaceae bacterium]